MSQKPAGKGASRRRFLHSSLAGVGALGVVSLPASALGQIERKKWNVLYICVDDLGIKLGAYGHPQVLSPNVDAFAQESLLFERAYCQVAVCTASRTSILTGIRPSTSGLTQLDHDWKAALPQAVSLPKHFQQNGYATHSIGKIFDPRCWGPAKQSEGLESPWDSKTDEWGVHDSNRAITTLRSLAGQQQPFFLAVGFKQPHCVSQPPSAESMALYDINSVQPDGPGRDLSVLGKCFGISDLSSNADEQQAKEVTMRFFASVTDMDRQFGLLMAEIRKLGLFDNSVIIFWSGDHGFHLGDTGKWGKWTNYDASTRVPLMMHVPGMTRAGARVPGIVECVDMYPTLLDLCGLPSPPQALEGFSFAPLFEHECASWKKAAFSQWQQRSFSIKTERYNFIRHPGNSRELFDLDADPAEATNLVGMLPDVAADLEARLEQGWQAAVPDMALTSCPVSSGNPAQPVGEGGATGQAGASNPGASGSAGTGPVNGGGANPSAGQAGGTATPAQTGVNPIPTSAQPTGMPGPATGGVAGVSPVSQPPSDSNQSSGCGFAPYESGMAAGISAAIVSGGLALIRGRARDKGVE